MSTIMPGVVYLIEPFDSFSCGVTAFGARTTAWETPPAGLVYGELDRETGALADALTPADRRYIEFFLEGTEPAMLKADPWRMPQFGPIVFR